jgi:2-hydroxychromene-2-carboxylate isomerase
MTDDVTLWFDPICPFTWRTSRWLRDVTGKRNLTVGWRLLSLAVLNEGKELPPQFAGALANSWLALRVLLATDRAHGQAAMAELYTQLGTRVHWDGRTLDKELIAEAVDAAGLPADLVDAAEDTGLDDAIRESHAAGQARVGTESGSPILAIGDGPGFFGPVVVPVPEGESAEKLFDAVRLLSAVPEFSELKRSRNSF